MFRYCGPIVGLLMANLQHALGDRLTVLLGRHVGAALFGRLVLFDRNAMRISPGILTNAGYLPGHFGACSAASDGEMIVRYLSRNVQIWGRRADCGELVTKIFIERAKPIGQRYRGAPSSVELYRAVIDILHIGRLNKGMVEVLVF